MFVISKSGVFLYNIYECNTLEYSIIGDGMFYSNYRNKFVSQPMGFVFSELEIIDD